MGPIPAIRKRVSLQSVSFYGCCRINLASLDVGARSNWEVEFRESLAWFSAAQPLHKVRWMELAPSCWISLPRGQQLGVLFWVGSELRIKRYFSGSDAIPPGIFASRWSRPLALQRHWLELSLKGAVMLCLAEPYRQAALPVCSRLSSLLPSLPVFFQAFSGPPSCSPLAARSVSWHLPGLQKSLFLSIFIFSLNLSASCAL